MKKTIFLFISLIFITAGTARAGQFLDYGSAQLALSDIDGFDSGISVILSGGKNIDQVTPGFSVEGEFSKSITSPEASFSNGFTSFKVEVDYFTLGGYGGYTHNFNEKFAVKGRAGLVYVSADASAFGVSVSDSSIELGFGISGLYNLNNGYQVIAEYTIIDDLTHLSAGISIPLDF